MIGVLIGLGLKGIVFSFWIAGEDLPSGLTALGVPVMDSVASRPAVGDGFPNERAEGRQW